MHLLYPQIRDEFMGFSIAFYGPGPCPGGRLETPPQPNPTQLLLGRAQTPILEDSNSQQTSYKKIETT